MPHIPVLVKEVLESLNPQPNQNFVDCTLGDGGHAIKILERIAPEGRLLGIDWDPAAIAEVKSQKSKVKSFERLILVNDNFKNLASIVAENDFKPVHGVLLDLGFSSSTLERNRGFSFEKDEPLDMRFNPKEELSAAAIVNSWSKDQIAAVLREYGEERLFDEIARAIIEERKKNRILTSKHLAQVVIEAYRRKLRSQKEIPWIGGLHPATRVFQALRLVVNNELMNLQEVLPKAVEILAPGGRLAVISFHSLEDRIVKIFSRDEDEKSLDIINKKPIIASPEEVIANPRARSAKMRVMERLIEPGRE
ncbi:MAG: 16S rRNA (cytosine(1402)-N(4))-methyltransferase RsmH [bacterium]|nr:16S rRNA (cytosine(1402)-N(4))-methyltransferase RsmH [bacterium]